MRNGQALSGILNTGDQKNLSSKEGKVRLWTDEVPIGGPDGYILIKNVFRTAVQLKNSVKVRVQ